MSLVQAQQKKGNKKANRLKAIRSFVELPQQFRTFILLYKQSCIVKKSTPYHKKDVDFFNQYEVFAL